MSRDREIVLSRRALLRVTAAGGAALLLLQPTPAFGGQSAIALVKDAGDIDAYVAATTFKGFTNLSEIHAEYRNATAKFPFALPPDWYFPAESSLRDQELNEVWERGNGVAEVYMYWQSAFAAAAYQAHLRGDQVAVESFLNTIEAGYNTAVRQAVLEDPKDSYLRIAVDGARGRDFSILQKATTG